MWPATSMTDMGKQIFEDDGRTICSMNVEGMPDSAFIPSRRRETGPEAEQRKTKRIEEDAMTPKEARRYSWYAVLAGLSVVGVVGGGTVLFIFILWLLWR